MDPIKYPFYDYFNEINGEFIKKNPIPEHKVRWGSFDILNELNEKKCIDILNSINQSNIDTIYSDFLSDNDRIHLNNMYQLYQCCIHNDDKKSFDTIRNNCLFVEKLFNETNSNMDFIIECIAYCNKLGINTLLNCNLASDPKNNKINILNLSEGGILLPEVVFYSNKSEYMKFVRHTYKSYIEKLYEYINSIDSNIIQCLKKSEYRKRVFSIEKHIANCFDTIENRNKIEIYYNKINLLDEYPLYNWKLLFKKLNIRHLVNEPFWITSKRFLDQLQVLIGSTSNKETKRDWCLYFQYTIISHFLPHFEKEYKHLSNLQFQYTKRIKDLKKRKSIKYRLYNYINNIYGFLIGKIYNHIHFNNEAMDKINDMIKHIKIAFKNRLLYHNQWMNIKTKEKAIRKLNNMKWKIAIVKETDEFPIYPQINIVKDNNDRIYYTTLIDEFYYNYNISKHNKPRIENEWSSFPHVVNAFYDMNNNEMTFPAGILQKPFFSTEYSDEKNYGGIGIVIGHELTHGFDTNGCKFDEYGEYNDWWTKNDYKEFDKKKKLIEDIYSAHEYLGMKLNGVLTSGENIADIGGLRISFEALKNLKKDINSINMNDFFKNYAVCECNYTTKKNEIIRITTDEHSPYIFRINIVCNYFKEFLDYCLKYKLLDKNKDRNLIKNIQKRIQMNIEIW